MDQGHSRQDDQIRLSGAVAMGTGVMIGAGIFALTGQIAQLAGPIFPLAFVAGAVVTSFSAYTYIKTSNAWPSSGGIAMILQRAYGPGAIAAAAALLMALSMVIAESLVARTFATYVLLPFGISGGPLVPALALCVILFAFLVNKIGNWSVGALSLVMAFIKIVGISVFGVAALWAGGFQIAAEVSEDAPTDGFGFFASIALAVLAFKGFTTITNSGGEIVDPHRNVGRTIVISIAICVIVYLLVAFAVGSSLTLDEIIEAKDYSLAEAAEPVLGRLGFYFTVILAAIATASGVLASVFAVSRMLTMLTEMKMIPHRHFGMSGPIRSHMLVYTVVVASILAIFFDLSRIASLGAFFYLVMDIIVHWGVWRHLRQEINASSFVILIALSLDFVVIAAFAIMKLKNDPIILFIAFAAIAIVFVFQKLYLSHWTAPRVEQDQV